MTDYVTISKAEIEAAINKFEGTDGWAARLADEIRALLDKAPSVEPVKPEYCWDNGYEQESFVADVMKRHAQEHNKKAGDFLDVNYAITGKAKYRVLDDDCNVEIYELTPAYYASPPQVAENPNPLTMIMLNYIKGEEEFDTTPLESDHIYVKHFKSLIQMRRDEVMELEAELERYKRHYINACNGRKEFRNSFRQERKINAELEKRIAELEEDAKRYRWLTYDHDDKQTRAMCREILNRMSALSYSAASTAIDLAIDNKYCYEEENGENK